MKAKSSRERMMFAPRLYSRWQGSRCMNMSPKVDRLVAPACRCVSGGGDEMRKFLARLLIAVFAFGAFAAGHAGAATAERIAVRIEVPNTNNLQFLTLWVALGAGFFQSEGLEPHILAAASPRSTGDKLFKGEADVALLPPPMFLGMMAEEKPILLFASLLANEPIDLILRKEIATGIRTIRAGAPLQERMQAIKGLRIGLAGEVAPRLRALFASAGMNADRDVQLVTVPGPQQLQAFQTGKVDALFAHTPYLETALVQNGAVLVADNSSGEVPELSNGQVHALATTREAARAHPQLIAGVTRAIARALNLIHADPKSAVDALIASGHARAELRPQLEAIVAIYGSAVPRTPEISLSGIARDAALYPAHPRAPDFSHVRAADYVAAH
jgi:NitT/TauT family transport system substrate-binding protein